jgi:hypothetical protein
MWFNQVKKEEGGSFAWTDAAAHNRQGRDNAAAGNILNFTGRPFPEQTTVAAPTKELTKIGAALRLAVREPCHDLQGFFAMQANEHTRSGMRDCAL